MDKRCFSSNASFYLLTKKIKIRAIIYMTKPEEQKQNNIAQMNSPNKKKQ